MSLIRHKYFLKSVLLYSLQSFGGPQAHISYLLKYFAFEKKIVTEHEIQEYFSICQLLPGPSSTQVLALIALKRGGYLLASLTMLIWVLPATIIMASIALCLPLISQHHLIGFFKFIPLLAIAFIIDALYRVIKNYNFTYIRFIFFVIFSFLVFYFFEYPLIFPITIIVCSLLFVIFNNTKKITTDIIVKKSVKFRYLGYFFLTYLIVGIISEQASINKWKNQNIFNLVEMNYRFGALVYGGGDVLIPVMYNQFVARPELFDQTNKKNRTINQVESEPFLIGASLIKVLPGPNYAFTSFIAGLVLKDAPFYKKIIGISLSTICIFLPGIFLLFFFYPIWVNVKQNKIVYRSLEGLKLSVICILLGSAVYFLFLIFQPLFTNSNFNLKSNIFNIIILFLLILGIMIKKIPTFVLLIFCFLCGLIFNL